MKVNIYLETDKQNQECTWRNTDMYLKPWPEDAYQ